MDRRTEEAVLAWCRASRTGCPCMRTSRDGACIIIDANRFDSPVLFSGETWEAVLVQLPPLPPKAPPMQGVTIHREHDGSCLVAFDVQPPEDVRRAMKAGGFRWRARLGAWTGRTVYIPAIVRGG